MKEAILTITLAIVGMVGFAQNLEEFEENGKYGFKNDNGDIVIPAQYDWVMNFTKKEELAVVILNDKHGYINKKGEVIIPLKYDYAYPFYEGLAAVKLHDKIGFIDAQGNESLPFVYDDCSYFEGMASSAGFYDNLAAVKKGDKWGIIDKSGNEVVPFKYEKATIYYDGRIYVTLNGSEFLIDSDGNKIND